MNANTNESLYNAFNQFWTHTSEKINDVDAALTADLLKKLDLTEYGTTIPTNVDLNDYTTPGSYSAVYSNISTISNKPTGLNLGFKLIVIKGYGGTRFHQFILPGGGSNLYYRMLNGTTWTSWVNFASTDSPTFTGTPKAPTAAAGTNTTQIATTAFVNTAITNAITTALNTAV